MACLIYILPPLEKKALLKNLLLITSIKKNAPESKYLQWLADISTTDEIFLSEKTNERWRNIGHNYMAKKSNRTKANEEIILEKLPTVLEAIQKLSFLEDYFFLSEVSTSSSKLELYLDSYVTTPLLSNDSFYLFIKRADDAEKPYYITMLMHLIQIAASSSNDINIMNSLRIISNIITTIMRADEITKRTIAQPFMNIILEIVQNNTNPKILEMAKTIINSMAGINLEYKSHFAELILIEISKRNIKPLTLEYAYAVINITKQPEENLLFLIENLLNKNKIEFDELPLDEQKTVTTLTLELLCSLINKIKNDTVVYRCLFWIEKAIMEDISISEDTFSEILHRIKVQHPKLSKNFIRLIDTIFTKNIQKLYHTALDFIPVLIETSQEKTEIAGLCFSWFETVEATNDDSLKKVVLELCKILIPLLPKFIEEFFSLITRNTINIENEELCTAALENYPVLLKLKPDYSEECIGFLKIITEKNPKTYLGLALTCVPVLLENTPVVTERCYLIIQHAISMNFTNNLGNAMVALFKRNQSYFFEIWEDIKSDKSSFQISSSEAAIISDNLSNDIEPDALQKQKFNVEKEMSNIKKIAREINTWIFSEKLPENFLSQFTSLFKLCNNPYLSAYASNDEQNLLDGLHALTAPDIYLLNFNKLKKIAEEISSNYPQIAFSLICTANILEFLEKHLGNKAEKNQFINQNQWRRIDQHYFHGYINLQGIDFSFFDLSNINLSNTNLSNSKFNNTNCTNAIFHCCNLSTSDFSGTNIDGAKFQDCQNIASAKVTTLDNLKTKIQQATTLEELDDIAKKK